MLLDLQPMVTSFLNKTSSLLPGATTVQPGLYLFIVFTKT